MFRRRRRRLGEAIAVILAVAVVGTLLLGKRAAKQGPAAQLSLVRMKIVETANVIEAAHKEGAINDEQYAEAKKTVFKAVRRYNIAYRHFEDFKVFAADDREEILALLLAVAKMQKEVKDE